MVCGITVLERPADSNYWLRVRDLGNGEESVIEVAGVIVVCVSEVRVETARRWSGFPKLGDGGAALLISEIIRVTL